MGDILVRDQMNVSSVLKLITFEVSDLLTKWIGDEVKALVVFSARYLHESFESRNECVKDRIKKISYTTAFMRIWKNHEKAANFITINTYTCIEINFYMIIEIYRKLRDINQLQCFLPWKFSSQTCEEFFRTARSFTTTESTMINFIMA